MDIAQLSGSGGNSADVSGLREGERKGGRLELGSVSRHVGGTMRTGCGLFHDTLWHPVEEHPFGMADSPAL